ncbi:MAG: glycosyltransferase family 39 protein, partial [Nitrospirae bacterium]|nr:glycosyltransferase family 39 protein [Candidatus Troglogloeales bacterium]
PFLFVRPDLTHLWRQTDTAAVARNFIEEDSNLFLPRVDIRGNLTGITGMEFPFYNYIVSLLYRIFGIWDPLGKWLSLACSTIALTVFYRLALQLWPVMASYATLTLLSSYLFFQLGSMVMPDMMAMAFHIFSVYFFVRFLDSDKPSLLAGSSVSFMLATLLRPYHGAAGIFMMLHLIHRQGIKVLLNLKWYAFGFISSLPMIGWYFFYSPKLSDSYGLTSYFFMGKPLRQIWLEILADKINPMQWVYELFQSYLNWAYLLILLVFLYVKFQKKKSWTLDLAFLWHLFPLLGTVLLVIILLVLTVGNHFFVHAYYMLPIIPYLSVLFGLGMHTIQTYFTRWSLYAHRLLIVVPIIVLLSQYSHSYIKTWKGNPIHHLETFVDMHVPKDALIITDGGNPITMYFAHRKGWTLGNQALLALGNVDQLKSEGASYVVLGQLDLSTQEAMRRVYSDYPILTDPTSRFMIIPLNVSGERTH